MELSISTLTSNRKLSKSMRSKNGCLTVFKHLFEDYEFKEPLHKSFLASISDMAEEKVISSKGSEYFEVTVPLGKVDLSRLLEAGYLENILIDRVYEILMTYPFCDESDMNWVKNTFTEWSTSVKESC